MQGYGKSVMHFFVSNDKFSTAMQSYMNRYKMMFISLLATLSHVDFLNGGLKDQVQHLFFTLTTGLHEQELPPSKRRRSRRHRRHNLARQQYSANCKMTRPRPEHHHAQA